MNYLHEQMVILHINANLSSHILSHMFGTSVTLRNGIPIETISKVFGHTSLKTTQIYAKILDKKISEDMDLLQAKLGNLESQKAS